MIKKNKFIHLLLLICFTSIAQEIEIPSLRSLALNEAADKLHSELVKPQSPAQRQIILDHWQEKAGIVLKHHPLNQQLKIATDNPKNESILERFEKKYALRWMAELNGKILAISKDCAKVCIGFGDSTSWVMADLKTGTLLNVFNHGGTVNHITLSGDKTRALSASDNCTAKLWDVQTGACLNTFQGHKYPVSCVTFTKDTKRALSASRDNTIKLWDLSTGDCLRTFKGHREWINRIPITSDSTKVIVTSRNYNVKIWDLTTGTCIHTLEGHSSFVNDLVLSSDDTKIVTASDDKTIKIWDVQTGKCTHTLEEHEDKVIRIALVNSDKVLSASCDKTIKMWNLQTGKCIKTFKGHMNGIKHVAVNHNNTKLFSVDSEGTLKVWNISTGECLQTFDDRLDHDYDLVIQKKLIGVGNTVYRVDQSWQEIIDDMPNPSADSNKSN